MIPNKRVVCFDIFRLSPVSSLTRFTISLVLNVGYKIVSHFDNKNRVVFQWKSLIRFCFCRSNLCHFLRRLFRCEDTAMLKAPARPDNLQSRASTHKSQSNLLSCFLDARLAVSYALIRNGITNCPSDRRRIHLAHRLCRRPYHSCSDRTCRVEGQA